MLLQRANMYLFDGTAFKSLKVQVWLHYLRIVLETLHFHPVSVMLSLISYGSHTYKIMGKSPSLFCILFIIVVVLFT